MTCTSRSAIPLRSRSWISSQTVFLSISTILKTLRRRMKEHGLSNPIMQQNHSPHVGELAINPVAGLAHPASVK